MGGFKPVRRGGVDDVDILGVQAVLEPARQHRRPHLATAQQDKAPAGGIVVQHVSGPLWCGGSVRGDGGEGSRVGMCLKNKLHFVVVFSEYYRQCKPSAAKVADSCKVNDKWDYCVA